MKNADAALNELKKREKKDGVKLAFTPSVGANIQVANESAIGELPVVGNWVPSTFVKNSWNTPEVLIVVVASN